MELKPKRLEIMLLLVDAPHDPNTTSPCTDVLSSTARDDEVRLTPRHRDVAVKPRTILTSVWRLPYFIFVVSIIEVLVFLCVHPPDEFLLVYDPHRRHQAWRFISYMLLHADYLHLALNVAIQCLLAIPLEVEQGHWRTAIVYLGGGLGGSLGTSLIEPELYVVGASAGVYALLISHLAHIVLNYGVLRYIAYRGASVLLIAAADVAFSLHHFSQGNVCPRIGWAAHSSGAVMGLLLGLVCFKSAGKPPCHFISHAVVTRLAAVLLGVTMVAAIGFNLLYTVKKKSN